MTANGFSGFNTLWTQGSPPVRASSGGTMPMNPVVTVKGTQQLAHRYPGQHFADMQAAMAAADPWRAGSNVIITRDAAGNPVFRDRQGRFIR
jgi:hypothetical protein